MSEDSQPPKGYFKDEHGNIRTPIRYELKDGKLLISYEYILEEGKTTLRGQYKNLADVPKCVHPDRLDCDSGEGHDRCEFMKYDNSQPIYSSSRWQCVASGKK